MGALGSAFFYTITPIQKHPCLCFLGESFSRNDQMPVHFTLKMEMDVPKKHCYHTSLSLRNIVCREWAHSAHDSAASADLSPKQRHYPREQHASLLLPSALSLGVHTFWLSCYNIKVSKVMVIPPDRPAVAFICSVHASLLVICKV